MVTICKYSIFNFVSGIWVEPDKTIQKINHISLGISDELNQFVERFKEIYVKHGVEITQIPRFLGKEYNINLSDLTTNEALINKLNEKVIQHTCVKRQLYFPFNDN